MVCCVYSVVGNYSGYYGVLLKKLWGYACNRLLPLSLSLFMLVSVVWKTYTCLLLGCGYRYIFLPAPETTHTHTQIYDMVPQHS
jgi:hypothetical protein